MTNRDINHIIACEVDRMTKVADPFIRKGYMGMCACGFIGNRSISEMIAATFLGGFAPPASWANFRSVYGISLYRLYRGTQHT